MTKDEALRLALEALEQIKRYGNTFLYKQTEKNPYEQLCEAITAIKAALEAKDKPVAWGVFEDGNIHDAFTTKQEAHHMAHLKGTHAEARPLYATPPQRTWVGLTDEEREQVINANTATGLWHMAKDIEAKLKERNK